MSKSSLAPTMKKTLVIHAVAVAGLACGALTGAFVVRDVQEPRPTLTAHADPAPADGPESGDTCVLPGALKPGDRPCY